MFKCYVCFLGIEYPAMIFADEALVEQVCAESSTCFVDATFASAPLVGSEDKFQQRQVQVLNVVAEFQVPNNNNNRLFFV